MMGGQSHVDGGWLVEGVRGRLQVVIDEGNQISRMTRRRQRGQALAERRRTGVRPVEGWAVSRTHAPRQFSSARWTARRAGASR